MSVVITGVTKNSHAEKAGIRSGDVLYKINGKEIADVLDYMYYGIENEQQITVKRDGKWRIYKISKDDYDELGLEFDTFLMDKKQSCSNKCVFCFIDQMPKGMRETLYFKDDDARLSFLQGNYVTLTNLVQKDIDRIIKMRLNVNVSVHTTNPELRCKMMKNRFAGEKLDFLRQMAEAGLRINCQIVLCPGLNDGDELRRTLTDLSKLTPSVISIAVVPVGLTKFREGLHPLTLFDKKSAGENIDIIEEFQKQFYEKYKTRLVFPSDEFYITAQRPIPSSDYYEDYSQYENGVGMVRSLQDEFDKVFDAFSERIEAVGDYECSVATGVLAYDLIAGFAKKINDRYSNVVCHVYKITNHFFGETITVTGLLTAQDIIAQLKGKPLGDTLILSSAMIRRDDDVFLDDMTIGDVERELGVKVRLTQNEGSDVFDAMTGPSSRGGVVLSDAKKRARYLEAKK